MIVRFTATFMLCWLQNWGRRWVYSFYWSLYSTYFWLRWRKLTQVKSDIILNSIRFSVSTSHKSDRSTHTAVLVAQRSLENQPIASTARRGFSFCNEILLKLFRKPRNLFFVSMQSLLLNVKSFIFKIYKNRGSGETLKEKHLKNFKSHLLIRPFLRKSRLPRSPSDFISFSF